MGVDFVYNEFFDGICNLVMFGGKDHGYCFRVEVIRKNAALHACHTKGVGS